MLQHRGYASLLQHDLRKPDAIRISITAPGQVALVAVVPGEQAFAEPLPRALGGQFFRGRHSEGC